MASFYWFLVGVLFFCLYAAAESSFVKVVCDPISMGQVNHQSLLKCEVKLMQPIPDLQITVVVWKKKGDESPIAVCDFRKKDQFKEQPGFRFPNRNMSDYNVSLLISNTEVKHQGEYTCMVFTSSGSSNDQTELKVTARYSNLTVRSIDAYKDPKVSKTLICEATGGYPEGNLRWIVENNTDWTKSSKKTVTKMENGLLKMHSELPLLKGSTFDRYTCVLFNSSGGRQESVLFTLHNQGSQSGSDQKAEQSKSTSAIVAPVVVIGSLIVGLLLALLFFRRRSKKQRRPSTAPLMGEHHMVPSAPEAEMLNNPPPAYEP